VGYIKERFEAASTEMVLVVTGFVVGSFREWNSENLERLPLADLERLGRQQADQLPSKVMIEYSIGTSELSRVPRQYVQVIDEIKCCVPDDLIEVIGNREIVLEKGVLTFAPPLGPIEWERF